MSHSNLLLFFQSEAIDETDLITDLVKDEKVIDDDWKIDNLDESS